METSGNFRSPRYASEDLTVILRRIFEQAAIDDIAILTLVTVWTILWLVRGKVWQKPNPFQQIWFERPQKSLEQANAGALQKITRNIAQKLEEERKNVVIFWGTQSGTAERFSYRMGRNLRQRFGLDALVADLSGFDSDSLARLSTLQPAIFLLSTYGEGDPSDNAAEFLSSLQKLPAKLSNLRYMAFGLGNSNYKFYNRVVDVFTETLNQHGAEALLPVARGDDAHDTTEESFLDWEEKVCDVLGKLFNLEGHAPQYEPTLQIVNDQTIEPNKLSIGVPFIQNSNRKTSTACSPTRALSVKSIRELYASEDRQCLHIELDLTGNPDIKYKTGDHLGIWPINPDVEVDRLLTVLGFDLTRNLPLSVTLLEPSGKLKIPSPTTAQALFRHYLEICAPVSRETVCVLAQFAPTDAARQYLTLMGWDKQAYADLRSRSYITLGRILEMAAGLSTIWRVPLTYLIETLPVMAPRYYSISSSSAVQPRQASITVAISDRQLTGNPGELVHGLATNYLIALDQLKDHPHGLTYSHILDNGQIHAHIRKSTFKLPVVSSNPIIMVGAGTGVAPFRGFLQERARLKSAGREVGKTFLFFGCRSQEEDYIYRDEFDALQASLGDTLEIVAAFSRPKGGQAKKYVQDRIKEHFQDVCELVLNQDAYFYICGAASMARDVTNAVGSCLKDANGWSEEQLSEWMGRQKRLRRWQTDVWK